ncbi:MAG: hypothetical protein NTV40_02015 [Solirubrobacterales bacterium]|nr:hypothetical protein [Solirubrobacterales bacterium]
MSASRGWRSAVTLFGALVAVVVLAACGTPSADLFVVNRSGTIPGAKLDLLVTDGGFVRCNGGPEKAIGEQRLLEARKLADDLDKAAREGRGIAAGPTSVLTYKVELENGSIRCSDTSRGITEDMRRVQALTRDVAKQVCGLKR